MPVKLSGSIAISNCKVVITENSGRPPEPRFDQLMLGEGGVLTGFRHVRRSDRNRR
jgi:hypothetical protein